MPYSCCIKFTVQNTRRISLIVGAYTDLYQGADIFNENHACMHKPCNFNIMVIIITYFIPGVGGPPAWALISSAHRLKPPRHPNGRQSPQIASRHNRDIISARSRSDASLHWVLPRNDNIAGAQLKPSLLLTGVDEKWSASQLAKKLAILGPLQCTIDEGCWALQCAVAGYCGSEREARAWSKKSHCLGDVIFNAIVQNF